MTSLYNHSIYPIKILVGITIIILELGVDKLSEKGSKSRKFLLIRHYFIDQQKILPMILVFLHYQTFGANYFYFYQYHRILG